MATSITESMVGLMVLFAMISGSVVIMEVSGVNDQFGLNIQDPNIPSGFDEATADMGTISSPPNAFTAFTADLNFVERLLPPLAAMSTFMKYIASFPGVPAWVANIGSIYTFIGFGMALVLWFLITGRKL
tara:strand:- start:549 stop:938 length:390 start_codon:yes stop_codon:yes gene_type:complete